jgi:electron transfer flavoprotein beta subunit
MNIVVCIKYVPDTSIPVEPDDRGVRLKQEGISYVISHYDLLALTEALGINRRLDGGTVTIICLGTSLAKKALRKCFSFGADRGILVHEPGVEGLDGHATALILAKTITTLEYDLVLCGVQATDTCCGQVGPAIAQILNIPLVYGVTRIDISPDRQKIMAQRKLERGNREVVEAVLPALLTVEATSEESVYPGLPMMIAAQRRDIEVREVGEFGLSAEDIRRSIKMKTLRISPSRPRVKRPFTPDSSLPSQERMRLIMAGGITEKKVDLLEGSPGEVAASLVRYLVQKKFVR